MLPRGPLDELLARKGQVVSAAPTVNTRIDVATKAYVDRLEQIRRTRAALKIKRGELRVALISYLIADASAWMVAAVGFAMAVRADVLALSAGAGLFVIAYLLWKSGRRTYADWKELGYETRALEDKAAFLEHGWPA